MERREACYSYYAVQSAPPQGEGKAFKKAKELRPIITTTRRGQREGRGATKAGFSSEKKAPKPGMEQ